MHKRGDGVRQGRRDDCVMGKGTKNPNSNLNPKISAEKQSNTTDI